MDSHSVSYSLLVIFCFDAQIDPDLATVSSSRWRLSPFDTYPLFLSTFYFWAHEDVPGSSGVFLAPAIELAISLWFLLGRMIIRNQDLGGK